MKTRSFCLLLLLLALCAALSGVDGHGWNHDAPPAGPKPPLARVIKCCQMNYRKLFYIMYHRPGYRPFNRFLRLYLMYIWMEKRHGKTPWMRLVIRWTFLKQLQRSGLYRISYRWRRFRSLRILRHSVLRGGKVFYRFLDWRWHKVLEKRPSVYIKHLTKFCRITKKKAEKICPRFDRRHCCWLEHCTELLKPASNSTDAATVAPSARPPRTRPPRTRPPTATTPQCAGVQAEVNGQNTQICPERVFRCELVNDRVKCFKAPPALTIQNCDRVTLGVPHLDCPKVRRLERFYRPGCYWAAVRTADRVRLAVVC